MREVRQIWKNDTLTDILNENIIYLDEHKHVVDKAAFISLSPIVTHYNGYRFCSYIPVTMPDPQFDFIVSRSQRRLNELTEKQIAAIVKKAQKREKSIKRKNQP